MKKTASLLAALALALPLTAALAQEADLRKTLGQRLPSLSNIDEVSKTPMQGVYEIRVGNDILYADAKGDFVLQGNLIDTRARKNLTEERIEKLTAIQFDALPLKNASRDRRQRDAVLRQALPERFKLLRAEIRDAYVPDPSRLDPLRGAFRHQVQPHPACRTLQQVKINRIPPQPR